MTEPVDMKRPPESGPGSGAEAWKAYAVKLTGQDEAFFAGMNRDEVIAYVEQHSAPDQPKQAPDGVTPKDKPEHKNAQGLPTWSVPVEGGYVAEYEMQAFERQQFERTKAQRG
jgi:hypothetical protein